MKRVIQKVVVISIVNILMLNCIFATTYLYEKGKKDVVAKAVFNFESAAQILIEPTTKKVIYENNADEKLLPASVTKIMTILLLMDSIDAGKIKYTDKIRCSANACGLGGSQIWCKENEELTVDDCLKAICVVSANDVAVAIAEHIGGSVENFVAMMNEKARTLNMTNTHFMNPHGIDEENHYTSARDIAAMSIELINKHPSILKYTSIWMDTLRDGTFGLTNTNKLIRFYQGATGLKTGSTSSAGFNLSATATRNNLTFLAIVLKAPSSAIRNEEVKQLLDYGFNNYQSTRLINKNESLGKIKIYKSKIEEIEIIQNKDINYIADKGNCKDIKREILLEKNLKAPIKAGTKVGEIIFKNENNILRKEDIKIKTNIEKIKFLEMLTKIVLKEIKL